MADFVPSVSYRTRWRSLRGPHDPLQRRAHTPVPPAPPRQTTSARCAAADRAGRPPRRILVLLVLLLIAVRLGPGIAGGSGRGRGEGLAVVAEPDAEPAYFRRRRRQRSAGPGGLTASLDAADATTRASEPRLDPVTWILVHVRTTVHPPSCCS